MEINLTVNGNSYTVDVEPNTLLVYLLREVLDLTGTHIGCDTSSCGACTVLLNGKAVKSCTLFAFQVDGAQITTVEGLAQNGNLHPVQQGFKEKHGLQCGFCTPGMLALSYEIVNSDMEPTEENIRKALKGNLCRCTGYQNIVEAIKYAKEKM